MCLVVLVFDDWSSFCDFSSFKHQFTSQIIAEPHLQSLQAVADAMAPRRLRTVYLVRDPRAVMTSQRELFKSFNLKGQSARACSLMAKNFRHLESASSGGGHLLVRYEDMSTAPEETAARIYDFLGVYEFPDAIRRWLAVNTRSSAGGSFATRRDSRAQISKWRRRLSYGDLRLVQDRCGEAFALFGYVSFATEAEYGNLTLSSFI